MSTALAVIETMPAIELFKPGALDPILDRIKTEARAEAAKLDISTEANRKALISLSVKVRTSKTFLDNARIALVSGEKERLKKIDQEGARLWDELEALQKEIRQPVTDWENAEKDRVAAHEQALAEIANSGPYTLANWQILPLEAMGDRRVEIEQEATRDWQEFSRRAQVVIEKALGEIADAISRRENYEREKAELDRLRAEAAAREQQERENRIAAEARKAAEEKARLDAKRVAIAAEAERLRIENEKAEVIALAKQAEARRLAAIKQARIDAEAAQERARIAVEQAEARRVAEAAEAERKAQQAEARRVAEAAEAERKAQEAAEETERAASAAAANAERERYAAVEAERARVAAREKAEKEEAESRERNKTHRAKINREALQGLCNIGVEIEQGKEIIEAIFEGQIPNVKIEY